MPTGRTLDAIPAKTARFLGPTYTYLAGRVENR